MKRVSMLTCVYSLFVLATLVDTAIAADWPTWRGNAGRSGATSETLPAELHLQWTRELGALEPAWSEDIRLHFDAAYQPIVVGNRIFVASSRNNSLTAFDTTTGKQTWQFFADGPIRFAPVAHQGRLYFGADDGNFYCLTADTGELRWKFRAAPRERRVIGNGRLTSVWPMRGGPVLADGKIHFTVGVWPFEGTLLYTLDAERGDVLGIDDAQFANLDDYSPQGYLAASDGKLFIPGGRANVHCREISSGKTVRLSYQSRGLTDYHVAVAGSFLFHGDKVVDTARNQTPPVSVLRPVADQGQIYFVAKNQLRALDLVNQKEIAQRDRKGKTVKLRVPRLLWSLADVPLTTVHLKAGPRLYANHENNLLAVDVPSDESESARVSWQTKVDGTVSSVIAADGKLFVVTREGAIHCYGAKQVEPREYPRRQEMFAASAAPWSSRVKSMLTESQATDGYAVLWGIGSGKLAQELVRQSRLKVVAIDPQAEKVAELRRRFERRGLYGTRLIALQGEPQSFSIPPYLAHLITSEDLPAVSDAPASFVASVFETVRPYGGTICLPLAAPAHESLLKTLRRQSLAGAKIERGESLSLVRRDGALPGAADWTHEYGDPANTLMSRDKLVKAPLGVLWFGGAASSGELFYDRHEWGPSLAVIEGRMFIQGPTKMTAVDVYTGRILWQEPVIEGVSPGRRANWTLAGFHYVAVSDGLYLAYPEKCLRIDPATGKVMSEFALGKGETWGRIRIDGDKMIVPVFREVEDRGKVPARLAVIDRHSGKELWSKEAVSSFPLVAVGGGRVFCYEGHLEGLYVGAGRGRKRGVPVADEFLSIKAFDLNTGKEVWSRSTNRPASWLAFSAEHEVLLVSNKHGIDAWNGKSGDDLWSKTAEGHGFRGHPENYWDKVIVWKDQLIDQRGPGAAYDLRTGKPVMRRHPISGEQVPWKFTKVGHHCNYAVANEHLMTFRAASAGFCDLTSGATARLEGFRSGCRNSLIPANGVLNAPNFAHGCVCSYSTFTSLALMHVPQSNLWTYDAYKTNDSAVQRVGINFGAPGDRPAEDGTVWLNYPNVGGAALNLDVKVSADSAEWFRLSTTNVQAKLEWVAKSGVKGVKSITIPLAAGKAAVANVEREYTVRLHFLEPDGLAPGQRVFDVAVQGKPALTDFDVAAAAGSSSKAVIKEVRSVRASRQLTISFAAKKGAPVISGVEVVAKESSAP